MTGTSGPNRHQWRIVTSISIFLTIINTSIITQANQDTIHRATPTKEYTVLIYMASANDLDYFAGLNIAQMQKVGSNQNVNIVVQHVRPGKQKAYRCLVGKGELQDVQVMSDNLNSGSAQTLIDFCEWGIKNYPAQKYALVFWNHGTGACEPRIRKTINPSDLFVFNPANNLLELDRNVGFVELMNMLGEKNEFFEQHGNKGICIDERFRTYITNKQLSKALKLITDKFLHGKKFDLIAFDACLMAMVEVAHSIKNYAHVMVGSQELELGTGWHYGRVLSIFRNEGITPRQFANHIVNAFHYTYARVTQDYTHSAIDLDLLDHLENNIHKVALLLNQCLETQKNNINKNILKMCRQRRKCTSFNGTNYVDLHHLYTNIYNHIDDLKCNHQENEKYLKHDLKEIIQNGLELLTMVVFSNKAGKNLSKAKGISIYFPGYRLDRSYKRSDFAQNNAWLSFIAKYLTV